MKKKKPVKKKQIKPVKAKKTAVKVPAKVAPKKANKIKEPAPVKSTKSAPAVISKAVTKAPSKVAPSVERVQVSSAPVTLGHKRTCPKCHTKFYDFAKNPILCPKCGIEIDPESFQLKIPRKSEHKRKSADKVAEAVLGVDDTATESDPIETADDLADDDAVVEEIIVEDDSDDEF